MADNIDVTIGFELESNTKPKALVLPLQQEAVVGSIVKLDGRQSVDPDGSTLTYLWSFTQAPIGSQVAKVGFTALEEDLSVVGFAPDIIGTYRVSLIVNDGSLNSDPTDSRVDVRIILVPHHKGLVPDASFIWDYLSDFWKFVEGRKKFEMFWSSAIQIVASELLKVYQYDYNKSIKDIQDVIQKKWVFYEPSVLLDSSDISFILSQDRAGLSAATFEIDLNNGLTALSQPDYTTFISIPKTEGDLSTTSFGVQPLTGKLIKIGDRTFTISLVSGVSRAILHNQDGVLTPPHSITSAAGGLATANVGDKIGFPDGSSPVESAIVATVIDTNNITITSPTWPSTITGVELTLVPSIPNNNAVFVDQKQVPGRQANKPWRISSTLISQAVDFEEVGVSVGDVIEVEINRQDVSLSGVIFSQVTSVDRNRLGFVINTDDLIDGIASNGLSIADQEALAVALQVPGLFINPDGSLFYSGLAKFINDTVSSLLFKRNVFEKVLTSSSVIDVGAFPITIKPVRIIRNRVIPVDPSVKSIPVLQEYIRQPDISKNETGITIITTGGASAIDHEPYVLLENLDYVIDDDKTIVGSCKVIQGFDGIQIPFGDLLDRSIREGDFLSITSNNNEQSFQIVEVIDEENLRVTPLPSFTDTTAEFKITRKVSGKFIRFVHNVFNKKLPAPKHLWAEVTYFDNSDSIENNFGILVGLTREDIQKSNAQIPYRSAVAGLMYALTTGPTVANLELAAQILLGLPFTQLPGIIVDINPAFRTTDSGVPLLGRILIEATDKDGNPTGITNIYLYPQGRQEPDPNNPGKFLPVVPELSGLGTNPNTGVDFAIGDTVAQFVPLSKGIQIREYIGTPNWFFDTVNQGNIQAIIEKFHSFNLLINSDLVSDADVDLASSFIKKAKPTYTKLSSGLLKAEDDDISIDDDIAFHTTSQFFDNVSLSMPTALKLDTNDFNGAFVNSEGSIYATYLRGDDLATTQSSNNVTSATSRFITAPSTFSDSPYIKYGDILSILSGPNAGIYTIQTVNSNTSLTLVTGSFVFQTLSPPSSGGTRQPFIIYRPIQNPIWVGTVNVATNSQTVSFAQHGIAAAGVAVGDVLVFRSTAATPVPSKIYKILSVNNIGDFGTESITVSPAISESTGAMPAAIVRERLLTKNLLMGTDPSFPTVYVANLINGSNIITFVSGTNFLSLALVRTGDEIIYLDNSFIVQKTDPANRRIFTEQAASVSVSGVNVSIQRNSQDNTVLSVDTIDRMPKDYLELDFTLGPGWDTGPGIGLYTSNGSTDVHSVASTDFADLGVIPGDLLLILTGADSIVDAGNGPGVFVIHSLTSSTVLRLIEPLTSTVSTGPGLQYGIRRNRPNER